jgi:hypothetical protein
VIRIGVIGARGRMGLMVRAGPGGLGRFALVARSIDRRSDRRSADDRHLEIDAPVPTS